MSTLQSQDFGNDNIRVAVRIRPLSKEEIEGSRNQIVELQGDSSIHISTHDKNYNFDEVFGPITSQVQVYDTLVAPLIDNVMQGYNVTVFAYGQTGSGKTYTMGTGTTIGPQDSDTGIIPRAVMDLYKHLENCKGWFMRVSFIELYNEVLTDLLDENRTEIKIMEKDGNNILFPCPDRHIQSMKELFRLIHIGTHRRATSCTSMNKLSSRSHAVFTVSLQMVEEKTTGEEIMTNGKMNFVDLAGSENIAKSGAENMRAKEAGKINQSLLAVGRVINALVEKSPHIPYRSSKLTRILQDSLGGNTKTTLIATISPTMLDIEETLKTLDYAHRAKKIKNHPEQSKKQTKKVVLNALTNEISQLQKDLEAQRTKVGIHLSTKAYNNLVGEFNLKTHEVAETERIIAEYEERLHELLLDKQKKEEELGLSLNTVDEITEEYKSVQSQLDYYKEQCELKKLVEVHTKHEVGKLSEKAETLLNMAKKTGTTERMLADKVNNIFKRAYEMDKKHNEEACGSIKDCQGNLSKISLNYRPKLHSLRKNFETEIQTLKKQEKTAITNSNRKLVELQKMFKDYVSTMDMFSQEFEKLSITCLNSSADTNREACNEIIYKIQKMDLIDLTNKVEETIGNVDKLYLDQQKYIRDTLDCNNRLLEDFCDTAEKWGQECQNKLACLSSSLSESLKKQSTSLSNQNRTTTENCEEVNSCIDALRRNTIKLEENFISNVQKSVKEINVCKENNEDIRTKVKDFYCGYDEVFSSLKTYLICHKNKTNEINADLQVALRNWGDNIKAFEKEADILTENEGLNFYPAEKINSLINNIATLNSQSADYTLKIKEAAGILEQTEIILNDEKLEEVSDIASVVLALQQNLNELLDHGNRCAFDLQKKIKRIQMSIDNIKPAGDTPKKSDEDLPIKVSKGKIKVDLLIKEYKNIMSEMKRLNQEAMDAKEVYWKYLDRFQKLSACSPMKINTSKV